MILDSDLTIVTGCLAAHPDRRGGQHVAKTCTAVLVIHNPSGIAFRSDTERSQHGNRVRAVKWLRELVEASRREPC